MGLDRLIHHAVRITWGAKRALLARPLSASYLHFAYISQKPSIFSSVSTAIESIQTQPALFFHSGVTHNIADVCRVCLKVTRACVRCNLVVARTIGWCTVLITLLICRVRVVRRRQIGRAADHLGQQARQRLERDLGGLARRNLLRRVERACKRLASAGRPGSTPDGVAGYSSSCAWRAP